MVVLAGVSGLVPESAAALLGADTRRVTSRCRAATRLYDLRPNIWFTR